MHPRFLPPLLELCGTHLRPGAHVLDVGCGNGYTLGQFLTKGCHAVGIDVSKSGIEIARKSYPEVRFELLPADDRILQHLKCEPFDLVVSTEVVEHLYDPKSFVHGCFDALKPGGRFICSTPYHGYLKNLLISLSGNWDRHLNPLWDGGHIKMWSRDTFSRLLTEAGFSNLQFRGVGRAPFLWMTMLLAGDKPTS